MTNDRPKTLEHRIAERIRQDPPTIRGTGRTVFLALKGEIQAAITAGWSAKDVWRTLYAEGKVQVTYQAFNRYVKRFIREDLKSQSANRPKPQSPGKPGFSLNPTPKKEDIV